MGISEKKAIRLLNRFILLRFRSREMWHFKVNVYCLYYRLLHLRVPFISWASRHHNCVVGIDLSSVANSHISHKSIYWKVDNHFCILLTFLYVGDASNSSNQTIVQGPKMYFTYICFLNCLGYLLSFDIHRLVFLQFLILRSLGVIRGH